MFAHARMSSDRDPYVCLCKILDFDLGSQPVGVLGNSDNMFSILSRSGIPDVEKLAPGDTDSLLLKVFCQLWWLTQ